MRTVNVTAVPCPLCGRRPKISSSRSGGSMCDHDVWTVSHELITYHGGSREDAVSRWNIAMATAPREAIEARH